MPAEDEHEASFVASCPRSESLASSDDSGGSAADIDGLKRSTRHDGAEDEDDEDDGHGTSFITGVFGVIYTVSREKQVSLLFVAFKLLMDALQLLLLTINPQYGFQIQADTTWWYVVSFVQLNTFMTSRGFNFFLACLYIFIFMLAMTVVLSLWVAWSFKNNRFDYVWPITFLKWFANIFFQVLDIASMTLFFITLDCQYNGSTDPAVLFHNQEFPEIYCWQMPYMIHAAVSALAVIVFVAMAAAFQMGDMETNPLHLNPLAEGHSKVEVIGFLLKFLMTASSVFVNKLKWLSVSYMICALTLAYLYIKWVPHYTAWVNYIRAGTYCAVLYSAVVMGAMVMPPIADNGTTEEITQWKKQCTVALVAGLVPAALLGAAAAYYRLRYFSRTVVGRYREAEEGADPELVHKFTDAREVEIAARCCRRWLDIKTVDPQAVELAHNIIKAGSKLIPDQAYMHILHSSFNVDVQHSMQTGLARLQAAKKADPSLLDRFAIFSREQQQTQSNAGMDNGNGADLMSYVQMQRSLRLAAKVYKRCLVCMCDFWQTLVEKEVRFEALLKCVSKIDESIKSADQVYRDIISDNLDNWKLIRIYARFLETIKNDPWNSAKWHAEADRLLTNAEEAQTNVYTTVNMLGITGDTAAEIKDHLDGSKATFLVNALGIILLTNKAALELFGYTRPQLTGSNISIIMPSPFREQHDKYMKQYVNTEIPTVLGKTTDVVAQAFGGHDFPVSLQVTKVSGMSLDSMFLGVIEPLVTNDSRARLWVMADSTIFGAERVFSDWFGYQRTDILKQSIMDYVKERRELEKLLKVVGDNEVIARVAQRKSTRRTSSAQYLDDVSVYSGETGVVRMKAMHFHHCYSGNVQCSLTIRNAGIGKHRFFTMEISRNVTDCSHMMLVVDNAGRIRHATQDLAELLGTSVKELTSLLPTAKQTRPAIGGVQGTGSIPGTFPLDALIPEAFASLHVHHIAGPVDTHRALPPYSCRSGISVCLTNNSGDGPPLMPFQLRVESKLIAPGDDFLAKQETLHIVNLTPRTMDEALDERRLALLLDLDGCIKSATGSSDVFGFDPQEEVGSSIGSFLDVMMDDEEHGDKDKFVTSLLKDLATRSVLEPGCSFRVGVVPPVRSADFERFGSLMTTFVKDKIKIPAVMQVAVTWGDERVGAKLLRTTTGALNRLPSGTTRLHPVKGTEDAEAPEAAPVAMIELFLWKSSVIAAVLKVDEKGVINNTGCSALHNPGLIFGLNPLTVMHGMHIGDLVSMGKHGVTGLFEKLGADKSAPLKSGMKSVNTKAGMRKTGPVNALSGTHVDGGNLLVNVQASLLKGGVSLVLHVSQPSLGMPSFRSWLARSNIELQKGSRDKSGWRPSGAASPVSGAQVEKGLWPVPSMPMLQLTSNAPSSVKRSFINGSHDESSVPSGDSGAPVLMTLEQLASELSIEAEPPKLWETQAPAQQQSGVQFHHGREQQEAGHDVHDELRSLGDSDDDSVRGSAEEDEEKQAIRRRRKSETKVALWSTSAETVCGTCVVPVPMVMVDKEQGSDVQVHVNSGAEAEDKSKQSDSDSEADAPNKGGSVADDGFSGDYRRGKRFKRLSRLLGSSAVQQAISRFQFRALSVVLLTLVVTVACFATAHIRITQQSAKVTKIQNTGAAANAISLITVDVQNLIFLYINFTDPDLHYLTSFQLDVPHHLNRLRDHALEFKSMLATTHDFVAQLPTTGAPMYEQLARIWYEDSLNISTQLYSQPINYMDYTMMNLWDAGNFLVNKALTIYQNAWHYQDFVPEGTEFANWSDVRCLLENTQDIVVPAIASTMDVLLIVVVDAASAVNSIHIYFLVIEGVVCCLCAVATMYIFTTQIVLQRWNTYNTFMVVPLGIIKALATKAVQNISSGEDDRERDNTAGISVEESFLEDGKGAINLTFRGKEPSKDTSILAIVKALAMTLAFWRSNRGGRVSPGSSHHSRKMVRTGWTVALFMTPFAAWGLIMIIINLLAHQQLALVANPTALFNLVNYNLVNFYRYYSFVQALVIQPDVSKMDGMRAYLRTSYVDMMTDYTAMLRGASAVNSNATHITLVKEGLTAGVGNDILYSSTNCMCLNQSDCILPSNHLYQYFHHGLDAMLLRYFEVLRTAMVDDGLNPLNSSAEFEYMVESYPNIEGGLVQLVQVNFQYVTTQYQNVLKTHIMALVVTLLLMAAFIVLLLRPFIRDTRAEPKRLAELLSQLPNDVNIEAFVKANLLEKSATSVTRPEGH